MASENKDGDRLASESGYDYVPKGDDSTDQPTSGEESSYSSGLSSSGEEDHFPGGTGSGKGGNTGGRAGGAQGAGTSSESKGSHGGT